ncbi:MAG: hypothetical protein HZC40_18925 [Chloroflexi bacterium]|nr:hypothetical protein [Chloroflexota bacterium]
MITNYARTMLMLLVAVCLLAIAGLSPVSAAIQATTTTPTVTRTATSVPATATAVPPTATKVATAVPPTATKVVTATAVPPTATKVATAVPPTATKVVTATATSTTAATATATKVAPPTATATRTPTKTPTRPAARAPRAGTVTTLSTAFVLQNMDAATAANVSATFYNVTGTAVAVSAVSVPINGNTTIDQRNQAGLATGFAGSVVVSSTTQLAAIVNEYSGLAASLGVDFRSDAYNGVPSSQANTGALLPQVLKAIVDAAQQKTYNSMIAIQNTSATASANVTITYTSIFPQVGTSTHSGIVIPPGSSVHIDMAGETPWAQFFGPANVTSNQSIAVIVNQNAAGSLLIYRGFTSADGGTALLVTQALTSIFDSGQGLNYGSAIEGMTVNGSSTTVTVNYTNLLGTTKSCTLPAGTTFRVDMRPGNWPAGCTPPVNGSGQFFGSISFTAGTPIVALSNLQSDYSASKGIRTSASRAFVTPGGTTTGYAPMVMRDYVDAGTGVTWGTALEGRFLSGTGTATIRYYSAAGTLLGTDTYTAGADQIFRFDQRLANPQTSFILPSGTVAAAIVTAPQSFVFTVNAQGAGSTLGDALTVYMSQ